MSPVTFSPLRNMVLLAIEPEPPQSAIIAVQKQTEGLARFGVITAVGPEVRDAKLGQLVWASITAGVELGNGQVLIAESAIQGLMVTP